MIHIEKALQRANFAVVIHSSDLVVREWNAGAERVFGFSAGEAVGKQLTALIGTKNAATRKDGKRIFCDWQEETLEDGSVLAFVTDVTESRIRERVLRMMLENLEIVAWQIDSKGVFTFHDGGKALAKVGLKPGQVVGVNALDMYGGDPTARAVVADALAGKATINVTDFADQVWQNWNLPLYDDDGELEGASGISLNISESRTREKELQAKLDLIHEQQNMIRELSIPLIETWEGVLTVPMVGVLDTGRSAEVMEKLLTEITERKSRFAIVDLTGVDVVDTAVASHIISLVRSIKLLGAEGIVTGIRPAMAQTMVQIGVDLTGIRTLGNLREALAYCIGRLGGI
jgi:rsbT co-antagonist protein RsbR